MLTASQLQLILEGGMNDYINEHYAGVSAPESVVNAIADASTALNGLVRIHAYPALWFSGASAATYAQMLVELRLTTNSLGGITGALNFASDYFATALAYQNGDMDAFNYGIGKMAAGIALAAVAVAFGAELGLVALAYGIGSLLYDKFGEALADKISEVWDNLPPFEDLIPGWLPEPLKDLLKDLGDRFDFDFPNPKDFWFVDPLVIDLNGDGISLTSLQNSNAYFDYDGDGFREHTGWVSPSDGILVRDLNANGQIDNLSELLANSSQNVFQVLSGLDSNHDGKITAADAVWNSLQIWQDKDGDGLTDAGELLTLAQAGVTAINLANTPTAAMQAGNQLAATSTVTVNGSMVDSAAVFFATDRTDATFVIPTGFVAAAATAFLPNLPGGGGVPPLYYSMTNSPVLLAEVKNLVLNAGTMTYAQLWTAVETMLQHWAASVADLPLPALSDDPLNPVIINASHLMLLQKFSGTVIGATVDDGYFVRLELAYNEMIGRFTSLFAAQVCGSVMALALNGDVAAQSIDLDAHSLRLVSSSLLVNPETGQIVVDSLNFAKTLLGQISLSQGSNAPVSSFMNDVAVANAVYVMNGFITDQPFNFATSFTAADTALIAASSSSDMQKFIVLKYLMAGGGLENVVVGNGTIEMTQPAGGNSFYYKTLALGGIGADIIMGNQISNILVGGQGNDQLNGFNGNDTYVYNNGDGIDTINEAQGYGTGDRLVLTGHSFAQLKVARSNANPNDLVLTFTNNADQVVITNGALSIGGTGVEQFSFAGGINKTLAELRVLALSQAQTAGNDTIVGFDSTDVFVNGAGNDIFLGLQGDDTYVYNNGNGVDTIDETVNIYDGAADKLVFTGHSFAELKVARSTTGNDLVLTFTNNSDQVIIKDGALNSGEKGVELFSFTGGVNKTLAEIRALALLQAQTAGNDTIVGFGAAETFVNGAGNDIFRGLQGDDTYVYNNGNGIDTIDETVNIYDGAADKLVFTGHSFAELKVARSPTNANDLVLTFTNNADQVIIKDGALNSGEKGVELFGFTGGVNKTLADIRALALSQAQTSGNDTIVGFGAADTFVNGAGNDIFRGLQGDDTYVYNNGNGIDTIDETVNIYDGAADKLVFTGHSFAELKVARSTTNANDLVLSFNNNADQVIIKDGALNSGEKGVELFGFTGGVNKTLAEIRALALLQAQTAGNDTIVGFSTNDTINGGAGNDAIYGLGGDDLISLGSGDDTVEGGAGADALHGDAGADTLSYYGSSTAVSVYLVYSYASGGDAAGDTFSGFENIIGSNAGNDTLMGDGLANVLLGQAGADWLSGMGGNDTLMGGDGADTLIGGTGSDYLYGGAGADYFYLTAADVVSAEADWFLDFSAAGGDYVLLPTALQASTYFGTSGSYAYGYVVMGASYYIFYAANTAAADLQSHTYFF